VRSGPPANPSTTVVGLDLAGVPHRDTGCCVYRTPRDLEVRILHTDAELDHAVRAASPALVVVDAPLSLPRGRASLEENTGVHFRECDRELRRLGIRFFPLTLGPMRVLTARGMRVARKWRREGWRVLEGYPGGAQDLLGLPRKSSGTEALQQALRRQGLGGALEQRQLTHDELDAVTIGWVGGLFLRGRGQLIGDPSEGEILLPLRARTARLPPAGARFPKRRAPK
jgi:predicted nuclease with RNAse H fold